jgi:hypothetical protein
MRVYISMETLKNIYIKTLTEETKDSESVQAFAHQKKFKKAFNKKLEYYISTLLETGVISKNDKLDGEYLEFPYYINSDLIT